MTGSAPPSRAPIAGAHRPASRPIASPPATQHTCVDRARPTGADLLFRRQRSRPARRADASGLPTHVGSFEVAARSSPAGRSRARSPPTTPSSAGATTTSGSSASAATPCARRRCGARASRPRPRSAPAARTPAPTADDAGGGTPGIRAGARTAAASSATARRSTARRASRPSRQLSATGSPPAAHTRARSPRPTTATWSAGARAAAGQLGLGNTPAATQDKPYPSMVPLFDGANRAFASSPPAAPTPASRRDASASMRCFGANDRRAARRRHRPAVPGRGRDAGRDAARPPIS